MVKLEQVINTFLSVGVEAEENNLTNYIVSGLYLVYNNVSVLIRYPIFTLLFFVILAILVVVVVFAVKKYIQCELLLSLKLFILAILLCFVLGDIYLVAFGRAKVFILFLQIQKDIFFILLACLVGLVIGKLLYKGSSTGDEVLP